MAKTIIFGNQKGGVAKTTSTYNVATQLALKGYRVLMVDSDPQASLTIITGHNPEDYLGRNLTTLLYDQEGKIDIHDCIISMDYILPNRTKGSIDLLSSDIGLACGDLDFVSRPRNSEILKRTLKKVKDEYDFICVDSLPSLSVISINCMSASDYIVGCVEPGWQAYKGIGYYKDVVERYIRVEEFETEFIGVIIAKTLHTNDSNDIVEIIKESYNCFGEVPLRSEVPKGELDGRPVSTRKPRHAASRAYSEIADNIIKAIKREGLNNGKRKQI